MSTCLLPRLLSMMTVWIMRTNRDNIDDAFVTVWTLRYFFCRFHYIPFNSSAFAPRHTSTAKIVRLSGRVVPRRECVIPPRSLHFDDCGGVARNALNLLNQVCLIRNVDISFAMSYGSGVIQSSETRSHLKLLQVFLGVIKLGRRWWGDAGEGLTSRCLIRGNDELGEKTRAGY